ncbi:MAG: metallophosphoesterase family protein [Phycisphaerae bacterium]
MLLGILSDSHGRHLVVRRAIKLLDSLGVGHLIHCGDVGGMEVFDEMVGRECTFVWGNTDQPCPSLEAYLDGVGIRVPDGVPKLLEFDGKRLAVFHGHEREFSSAPYALDVDYILHGHSHQARDDSLNGTRLINPGALHRANPKTVATLDTRTDELAFHRILQA